MYLGFLCKVFDIGAPPLNLSLDAPLSNEVDGRSIRDCSRMTPGGYEMGSTRLSYVVHLFRYSTTHSPSARAPLPRQKLEARLN
jgi:hypothetical protein